MCLFCMFCIVLLFVTFVLNGIFVISIERLCFVLCIYVKFYCKVDPSHKRTRREGGGGGTKFFKWPFSGKNEVIFGQCHLIFEQAMERNSGKNPQPP